MGPADRDGVDGKDSTVAGPKGDPGMTREEIVATLIEVLSDVGVMTEQATKLLQVRAKLKSTLLECDVRHQSQLGALIKSVDKIFRSA